MKKNLQLVCIGVLMLCFIPQQSFAQEKKIVKGIVCSNMDKEPIPGANVIIKGTTIGVITDVGGHFTLSVPSQYVNKKIEVSSIGFEKRIFSLVANKLNYEIFLNEQSTDLDEVVVVGYGHAKKSDLTGSVSSVTAKEMEGVSAVSLGDLLKGRAAGVKVTSADGAPGTGVSISIRGSNSINASSEPLYVIDGMPIVSSASDYNANNLGGGGAGFNPLADINPEDITSINILKDASATAIYGSRGANGVVIVTTRQAESGPIRVSYSGSFGVQLTPEHVDMMNSEQFSYFRNEASLRYSKSPVGNNLYDQGRWNDYNNKVASLGATDWNQVTDTDWQDQIYRMGFSQNHQFSLTGGNDRTKFIFSGDVNTIQGIVKSSGFKRFSGRAMINSKVKKWLSFNTNNTYGYTQNDGITQASGAAGASGVFIKALRYSPLNSRTSSDFGDDNTDGDLVTNPLILLNDAYNKRISKRFNTNNTFTFSLAKGLTLKSMLGGTFTEVKHSMFYPQSTGQGMNTKGTARIGNISMCDLINENTLNYSAKFAKRHKIDAMVGASFNVSHREYAEANAQGFYYEDLGVNNIGAGTTLVSPFSNKSQSQMASFMGRVNYNYKERYLLTASLRADGSSKFGDNKWGYFPSTAFAWRLSEEPFIKRLNVFSNLKARIGYGLTGNQSIGNYKSLQTYGLSKVAFGSGFFEGIKQNNVGNTDLSWETTRQLNLGMDFGFFNNRLTLTADYYYKVTSDLLLDVPTRPSSGYSSIMQNIGKVRNVGYELTLHATLMDGRRNNSGLSWDFDLNFAQNKNTVLSLGTTNEFFRTVRYKNAAKDQVIVRVGESLGTWFGYQTDGIFQYGDPDLDRFTSVQGQVPAAGDWKYVDQNNDNKIDESDRVVLGCSAPKFYGGFSTSLRYKRFELRAAFEYSYGSKIFNANRIETDDPNSQYNKSTRLLNCWVGPEWELDGTGNLIENPVRTAEQPGPYLVKNLGNPSNTQPRAGYTPTHMLQSNYIEDGSYLRLSNIVFLWSPKFASKLGLRNLKFSLAANNLFLWTKYTGSDPEVNIDPNGYGSMIAGYDYDAYPRSRMFTFGVNFSF